MLHVKCCEVPWLRSFVPKSEEKCNRTGKFDVFVFHFSFYNLLGDMKKSVCFPQDVFLSERDVSDIL